jgi:PAS domain S-box-containing protein
MDGTRAHMVQMNASSAPALAQRDAQLAAGVASSEYGTALLAGAFVLLLAIGVLFWRDKTPRVRTRQAHQAIRQDLERQVAERTAALESTAQELALGKARLEGIFESATDAILTADEQQTVVAANVSAARLFRCAKHDLIGAPLERLIPARFHQAHRRDVEAFGAGGHRSRHMGRTQEVLGLRADGEEFPIDASISHLRVGGQRLYTVILRDITQRRQNEAALRASRAKLDAALAGMSDAVFIADTEGHLLEFNDAFVSFHHFGSRQECPRTLADYPAIFDVSMADGAPAPLEQWAAARALRGEVASSVEYTLRRKDTGQSWIGSFSFAPIRATDGATDGAIVGAVVTGRDVSGIKRAQADLAASRTELQRLVEQQHHVQEEERKRIARELHDDLQQSLAAIRMDAVAVGERLAKGRGDTQELLTRIDRLSAAAIASTRRIVSDLRPEMLEELGLVPALEAMCTQHAARTGARCRFEVPADAVDAQIESATAATGLYRIAQEALNNVAKHAKATEVVVRLDRTSNGLVILRVSDNGVGWVRRDQRPPESFGLLGMAERVRALGGQLRIEGRANVGTTIEVLIPPIGPAPQATVASAGTAHLGDAVPEPRAKEPGPVRQQVEQGQTLQSVIDALAGNVSVLDDQGVIVLVNRAWREFAARNGDPALQGCGPGANYLEVCRRSAATDSSASHVLHGLSAVLAGHQAAFSTEYLCDTSDGRSWFRMHAAGVTGGLLIVTHVDLGTRINEHPDPVQAPQASVGVTKDAPD